LIKEKSETNQRDWHVLRALARARMPILTAALTYALAVVVGVIMVHTGSEFAIARRDAIVAKAQSSPTITAFRQKDRLEAAVLDFGANLFGAMASTVGGLGVLVSYPIMAYRGWIGGIVSLDSAHLSRLADLPEAMYYCVTLALQLIPYTLAGGAGVNMGLAFVRPKAPYQGEKWLGVPKEAIRDVLRIYLIVVPLFLLASLWEFFAR
jgi:uncharacterized membrane protein SpoIIM required for sporulation